MKNLLRIEEGLLFGFSIYLFSLTDFAWWWYLALILAPDVGMFGYLVNARIGAWSYNFFHHKAVAVLLLFIGYQYQMDWILLAGIIHFGHSSMDRMLGYGLKYEDGFKHTHLGTLP